ncbi:MAG TPA: permease [Caldisericia bacterium]|nr:permease [Caldisericia bacterium]HPF48567.1 permease [Caldisericia bacterium]HPI83773.1 permease [Caldisericia bacterium]HPQ93022.1 permease [Caldisericia bacterium]HRV75145.1 permease [Caldisericia bacterium]
MKNEIKIGLIFLGVFLLAYFIDLNTAFFLEAISEALRMLNEYARLHILTCLVPALFIAGGITNMISSSSVIRILSGSFGKFWAYLMASVSGSILAVCSCTVLPLFAGIYNSGAGIGPATTFLFSGPAINILAMVLSFKALGWQIGLARIVSAILLAVIIGIIMEKSFKREDSERISKIVIPENGDFPVWKSALILTSIVFVLIFATWNIQAGEAINSIKWWLVGGFTLLTLIFSILFLNKKRFYGWMDQTWTLTKQILPLLFFGVLISGFIFKIIPQEWIQNAVGGNSILSNLAASVVGAFMYFATLTEVPIVENLMKSGMGNGPALSLLLAGPALSLPSMLVVYKVLGSKKAIVFFLLVIVLSALAGWIFGMIY